MWSCVWTKKSEFEDLRCEQNSEELCEKNIEQAVFVIIVIIIIVHVVYVGKEWDT